MFRKVIFLTAAVFSGLFVYTSAMAAWSFDISSDYVAGDSQAIFNLNFSTDDVVEISIYAFEFTYDQTELSYVGYTNTPLAGLFAQLLGKVSYDQGAGTLDNFNASGFSSVSVNAGDYLIGSFTFNVTNAVTDGTTDFNFDYEDEMFGYKVNGVESNDGSETIGALTNFTDIGPATPTPVPSALWLFGSGIAGLAWFRRKTA